MGALLSMILLSENHLLISHNRLEIIYSISRSRLIIRLGRTLGTAKKRSEVLLQVVSDQTMANIRIKVESKREALFARKLVKQVKSFNIMTPNLNRVIQ